MVELWACSSQSVPVETVYIRRLAFDNNGQGRDDTKARPCLFLRDVESDIAVDCLVNLY
jgi:hypothetical protein